MTNVHPTYLKEEELVRQAITALLQALGPVEATRFLTLPRRQQVDSVQRHREWQETLDQASFFDQVFDSPSS
jgi:hypothetical protein